jgi:glyoxylase-like metal-dependent hydrolase (beta-lactamase superfamily II)
MRIIPLSEGSFTVDKTKSFVPFDKATDDLQQRTAGSLLVEIQPFAIVTRKDVLLLDTGLGFHNKEGMMQIHQNLINNRIEPASVTKILLSHLHKDHAGGIQDVKLNASSPQLSFPNATYYVNKKEFEFASEKNNTSYIPSDFSLLNSSGKLVLLEDHGNIDDIIYYEMCGGHCPYHTVFWIKENNELLFYGGDVAPQLQQLKNRFIAKYDFDGRKSMELRNKWWEEGKSAHWTFLFYHDIKTPTISL